MKKTPLTLLVLALLGSGARAETVTVTMDRTSPTMTLAHKATGEAVLAGEPQGMVYTFEAAPGDYVMTAHGKDGISVTGTMEISVNSGSRDFAVNTCTIGALNSGWVIDDDYTVTVDVVTREGLPVVQTLGDVTAAGRRTFLALSGNSFYAAFIPNETHQQEGYMTAYRSNTLTGGINVLETIRKGDYYTISLPADAQLLLATKTVHYVPFDEVQPESTEVEGGVKKVTYRLADYQTYNYRTWREGGLTQGGFFTMRLDPGLRPQIGFTEADYEAFAPQTVKHDTGWNGGYETGDIFVNINERGHLRLSVGQSYDCRGLRSWQLTDTQTNNYFIEPDFHYTVTTVDGAPSEGVVEIDHSDTTADPWTTLRAVGQGTAIVTVTYDAIGLNYYKNGETERRTYMGGQYWSAIWPENTAVFIVTVGDDDPTGIDPNMTINEAYNEDLKKLAGKYVDAEHDVFYYLDTDEGYRYTFTPTGVVSVEMARPTIGEHRATYSGFSADGVTKNADGSYTLLLKEGRQIVRLADPQGRAVYQVLTAKTCHRDIENASRPGSSIFQPGDKVKVQYTGLRHPANKLAGIYNMSAYVTYNGTPNGTSLILSPNQYTFGSAASAQAVTIDIPSDYDAEAQPEMVMDEGVIQVNGYGDPIGNHRNTTRTGGRSANFTAVAHKTYFGAIPEVRLRLTPTRLFTIRPVVNVEGAVITIANASANDDGTFTATYGTYAITAAKAGYRCYRSLFTIADDAEGEQILHIDMQAAANPDTWDGLTATEPQQADNEIWQIGTGAELAWFAQHVNDGKNYLAKGVLTADIDLGDYQWTPIGGSTKATAYKGQFDGQEHTVGGLYIDRPEATHQALFGMIKGRDNVYSDTDENVATVSRVAVEGTVSARQYVAGVVAYQDNYSTVDRCTNRANVAASYAHAGGVVAFHNEYSATTSNALNEGSVTAPSNAGGVVGTNFITSTVENTLNVGTVTAGAADGACVGGNGRKDNVRRCYATAQGRVTLGHMLVSEQQMQDGEVAWLLGDAFGQTIGTDAHPVVGGQKVYKVVYTSNLSSEPDSLFTNGKLPQFDDIDNHYPVWRTSPDGEKLTEVIEDCTLFLDYEEASGVTEIVNHDKIPSPVYDLQGRRQKNMIKKGIYIVNGRCVLSK